jgi:hypothetical protein
MHNRKNKRPCKGTKSFIFAANKLLNGYDYILEERIHSLNLQWHYKNNFYPLIL